MLLPFNFPIKCERPSIQWPTVGFPGGVMAVILALVVAVLWGFGNVFQKHGMSTSFPKISLKNVVRQIGLVVKTLFTNWLWLLGTLMMLGGGGVYLVALGYGDVTVVQPILCLTVAVSAIVGVVWLKEKVSVIEWAGILMVLAGVILVSIAGGGKTAVLPAGSYLLIFFVAFSLAAAAAFLLGRVGISIEFSLALSAGLVFGLGNVAAKLMMMRFEAELGSADLFQLAAVQSILTDYPIILVIAANIVGSIFYQTAFANGRASIVASICTIVGNTVPIIAAITIFGEQVKFLHGLGIIIVLVGAFVLAIGNRQTWRRCSP